MSVRIQLEPFALDLEQPLQSAGNTITKRRGIAIRVLTQDGYGVGEATPLRGWTESYTDCEATLASVAGKEYAHPGDIQLPSDCPAARHGLQLAVTDYAATKADQSLAHFLGGSKAADTIPVNATIGNEDVAQSIAAARRATDAGFSTVKCKIGDRPVDAERERVIAIREAVGPETTLRLDANRSLSLEAAQALWPVFEALDVAYVEEPIHNPDPDRLQQLHNETVGIAIDESLHDQSTPLDQWFSVIDAMVLKPMPTGGIDRALRHAMHALRAGVQPVISGTVDGVIARSAAKHLASIIPQPAAAGLSLDTMLKNTLSSDPMPVQGGAVRISTDCGIGTAGPWDGIDT